MPIYEYTCACGNTFEILIVRRSDEEEVQCPACQGKQVQRVIAATRRAPAGVEGGTVPPGGHHYAKTRR